MRAVLVVNPQATSTTASSRDVIAHALASEVKLDLAETTHRGHAAEISAAAAKEGVDLVLVHGGDGTINEAVNGMLAANPAGAPTLGVIPGGSANVFARATGYPTDAIEATAALIDGLACHRYRRINLGKADNRWFTCNSGMGWDADVVATITGSRGKKVTAWQYARTATARYFRPSHGRPPLSLQVEGRNEVRVRTAFISNTDPWSYLGPQPIRLSPGCTFDNGLGVFALRGLDVVTVLTHLAQAVSGAGVQRGIRLVRHDDLPSVRIRSERPVNLQVDGDLVGERTDVTFTCVPQALNVVEGGH